MNEAALFPAPMDIMEGRYSPSEFLLPMYTNVLGISVGSSANPFTASPAAT